MLHDIFVALGLLVASAYFFTRLNVNHEQPISVRETLVGFLIPFFFWGFVGSFLFAHIEYFLLNYTISKKLITGERLYGALVFGFIYILLFARRVSSTPRVLNAIAESLPIGFALGKIGCFLDGHYGCYGIPTDLPWGVVFAEGAKPAHPTQLYDAAFLLALHFILRKVSSSKTFEPYIIFFLLFSAYNFGIEFIRTNPDVMWKLSLAQVVYIIMFGIATILAVKRYKHPLP